MNCQKCGKPLPEGITFCENCAHTTQPDVAPTENVFMGIIGSLIGALLGGVSIILLSRLGYVAAISGVLLAFCTLTGYQLLGKKLSVTGIIVSILFMIATPYLADRLDWAIVVVEAWGDISLIDAFRYIPELIREGVIDSGDYQASLVKLYLFVALGGIGTVISTLKKNKAKKKA